jgi:hypothetical protein
MLPNMAEPLLVLSASTFAQSLTAISALSFVGLGVQSPAYDWGKLLNDSLPSLLSGRAYQMVGPATLIVFTGLAAVLIGDGQAPVHPGLACRHAKHHREGGNTPRYELDTGRQDRSHKCLTVQAP